jgi:hypothetical protein
MGKAKETIIIIFTFYTPDSEVRIPQSLIDTVHVFCRAAGLTYELS